MAKPDNFCLKWNEFPNHLHTTFTSLLTPTNNPPFSDLTISCQDGEQVSAHRLVLAGCSSVLRTLLTNSHSPPQVRAHLYLRGVSSADLSALLSFMYQGEVSLPQDQLNSFLSLAEDLQVKGLVESGKSGEPERELTKRLYRKVIKTESEPPLKKVRVNVSSGKEFPVKSERRVESNTVENTQELESDPYRKYVLSNNIAEDEYENFDDYANGDLIQDQLSAATTSFSENISPDGRTEWTCNLCGKVFHHPGSTSQHIAVHQGRTTCAECGKVFNRISDMRTHSRNVHQILEPS